MAIKEKRQAAIQEIIASQHIETQEDLAGALSAQGFSVTQATVSRDIRELRLLKVLSPDGRYRYATAERGGEDIQSRLNSIFSTCVLSVVTAGNLVVIKTLSGSASAAAEAIDSMQWPELLGSIAGDNTIFLAVENAQVGAAVAKRFERLMK